jgi:spermidine synthase
MDGVPKLTFRKRDGVIEILAGAVVLLSSAALETERAFGRMIADVLARPPKRVLVGGLGFGATLRGVLDVAPSDAEVVVAEKIGEVADLVRGEFAHLEGRPLDDPRVRLAPADVHDAMRDARAGSMTYDAILLDVDNGPHWASFRANARLYTPAGLALARESLAPGGIFAVWSGYPADAFLARLREAGFAPTRVLLHEKQRVRARAYVGRTHAPG